MHNFYKSSLLFLATLSVTSCGVSLRPEVADFIANFSYQNARNNVKKGHYIDEEKGLYQGKDMLFYDEVEFDVRDPNSLHYKHVFKTVNFGLVLDEEYTEEIVTKDGVYTYTRGETSKEISYAEAYDMTKRFFFSNYSKQTDRYNGAMYYGDMVKDEAIKQQNFVTISEDKQEYRYRIDKFKSEGVDVVTSIDYKINRLGMLISLSDSAYSESDPLTYYNETIVVEY